MLIRWIRQFTPLGGGGSDQEALYFMIMRGECASAHELATRPGDGSLSPPARNLHAAVASACLAAFEGHVESWEDAASRLSTIEGSNFSCWEQELHEIATRLVEAHAVQPEATFERSGGEGESSCPFISSIDPASGPIAGGYTVRVTGHNLPASLSIYFGQTQVDAVLQGDGSSSVLVPEAAYPGPALIHIAGAPGRGVGGDVAFTYVDQPSTTDGESASEAPDEISPGEPLP